MRIIKLIKIKKKIKTKRKNIKYNICLTRKSSHKNFVIEKLGTYSPIGNLLNINIFRLIFYISKNVSFTGNALVVLKKYKILNYYEKC